MAAVTIFTQKIFNIQVGLKQNKAIIWGESMRVSERINEKSALNPNS